MRLYPILRLLNHEIPLKSLYFRMLISSNRLSRLVPNLSSPAPNILINILYQASLPPKFYCTTLYSVNEFRNFVNPGMWNKQLYCLFIKALSSWNQYSRFHSCSSDFFKSSRSLIDLRSTVVAVVLGKSLKSAIPWSKVEKTNVDVLNIPEQLSLNLFSPPAVLIIPYSICSYA